MIRPFFSKYASVARWSWVPALMLALAATPSLAQDDDADSQWAPSRNWMTVRGGYAKSGSEGAGNGFAGVGLGFSRMLGPSEEGGWRFLKGFALGFYVHYDILGRFGRTSEISVPVTIEFVRHLAWGSRFRPYFGFGGGAVYRKTYRTGDDLRTVKPSYLFVVGANSPLNDRSMLGFDVRLLRVDGVNDPANSVFGPGSLDQRVTLTNGVQTIATSRETTHWSVKLAYSVTY